MSLLNKPKNNSDIRRTKSDINNKDNNEEKKILNEQNEEEEEDEEEEEEEEEEGESKNGNEYEEKGGAEDENENQNENGNENEEEEEDEENLSLLDSYKYRLNFIDNLKLYPRPKIDLIIYKGENNDIKYTSNSNNKEAIPSVRAYFTNIEESNSSLKLIRPSQHVIPHNINYFKKSLNLFSINVEPFALEDKQNSIEFIQKIGIDIKTKFSNNIIRCENCHAVYHKFIFNHDVMSNDELFQNNKIYCFICKHTTYFYTINNYSNDLVEKIKNLDKIRTIPNIECVKPSVEYIIKEVNDTKKIVRNIIQIIILDMTNKNLINYIYQLLNKILNENKCSNFKYILIGYDNSKVYYVHFNNSKNKTIKVTIMNDINNPFCPVDPKVLIYNKDDFIELLDIFYNSFILVNQNSSNINNNKTSFNYYDLNNSIIKSIFHLAKINNINENNNKDIINYYHIILFSSFHHNIDSNILEENKIYKIFLSFFLIINESNKNIPFLNSLNTNIAKLYYYPIQYDDPLDKEQKYQKIKYDLTTLLLSPNNYIFDVKINICYNKNIFKNFFNNDCIYINFIPNNKEFNKLYIIPQQNKPSVSESINFQFNLEYFNLSDNYKHIRILTFTNKVSDNCIDIFKSYDEEVLFRAILQYHITELNLNKNNFASINKLFIDISNKKDTLFLKVIKDIEIKIKINFAKNYRFGEERYNIFTPLSCRNFSIYFFSFIKQISNGDNLNLFNILYDGPISTFIKNTYPTLLGLGYKCKKKGEIFNLHPLSVQNLERDQILLLDNGNYITILINSEVNKRKKEHYLKNFNENNKDKICDFNVESPIIIDMIDKKPMKILYLDDETVLNKKILKIFLEDIIIKNVNDDDDLIKNIDNVNQYIQDDVCYPNYYDILTGNLYEYLE